MNLMISFIVLALFAGAPALRAAGDAKAGKTVYETKCKLCHGATGEGNSAIAKTLKAEFKPLGSKEIQAKSDDEMKKQITQGGGKMKAVAGLSDKDVQNVIAYVRSLKKS